MVGVLNATPNPTDTSAREGHGSVSPGFTLTFRTLVPDLVQPLHQLLRRWRAGDRGLLHGEDDLAPPVGADNSRSRDPRNRVLGDDAFDLLIA